MYLLLNGRLKVCRASVCACALKTYFDHFFFKIETRKIKQTKNESDLVEELISLTLFSSSRILFLLFQERVYLDVVYHTKNALHRVSPLTIKKFIQAWKCFFYPLSILSRMFSSYHRGRLKTRNQPLEFRIPFKRETRIHLPIPPPQKTHTSGSTVILCTARVVTNVGISCLPRNCRSDSTSPSRQRRSYLRCKKKK